jgi:hypothetical protein
LKIRPAGFLDLIETSRSETLPQSVNTSLGSFPLVDTPSQNLVSTRHSRFMLTADLPVSIFSTHTYLESDMMDTAAGQSAYRWRQYWTRAKFGKWEVLGGKAWSLLRPNRRGIASDVDVMNTDVVEPAYHVGLLGSRRRQIRVARTFTGNMTLAVAWEGTGNTVAKFVRDQRRLHWEIQALGGPHGRRGVGAAAVYFLRPRVRLITQDFWSRHAISEALGLVPAQTDGFSLIQGAEVELRRGLEIYSYAGVVTGSRSAGNHTVDEWSVGLNHSFAIPSQRARVRLSLEFSHLDRFTWAHRSGHLNYVMAGLRYALN